MLFLLLEMVEGDLIHQMPFHEEPFVKIKILMQLEVFLLMWKETCRVALSYGLRIAVPYLEYAIRYVFVF